MNDKIEKVISNPEDYKYGFKNEDVSDKKTNIGLNEDIVREISSLKNEPESAYHSGFVSLIWLRIRPQSFISTLPSFVTSAQASA